MDTTGQGLTVEQGPGWDSGEQWEKIGITVTEYQFFKKYLKKKRLEAQTQKPENLMRNDFFNVRVLRKPDEVCMYKGWVSPKGLPRVVSALLAKVNKEELPTSSP